MDIRRRRFVQALGLGIGATALVPTWQVLARPQPAPRLVLLLTGITPATPPSLLARWLDTVLGAGLPVTCALAAEDPRTGAELRPDRGAGAVLRQRLAKYPDRLHIAAQAPGIADQQPYFQMRIAADLRARLLAGLGSPAPTPAALRCMVGGGSVDAFVPSGIRSAGFDLFLTAGATSALIRDLRAGPDFAQLRGGREVTIAGEPGAVTAALEDASGQGGDTALMLTLDTLSLDGIQASADAVAQWFAQPGAAPVRAVGLADLRARVPGLAALLVEDGPDAAALRAALVQAGIPFTRIGALNGAIGAGATCLVLPASGLPGAMRSTCAIGAPAALEGISPDLRNGIEVLIGPAQGGPVAQGIGADARLHLGPVLPLVADPTADWLARAQRQAGGPDVVLLAAPPVSAEARASLLRGLLSLEQDGSHRIVDIATLDRAIRPDDPVLGHFRTTRRRWLRDAPDAERPDASERAALLDDARLAWSYFERLGNARTGLCATTAQETAVGVTTTDVATMWDAGSQITAIVSAWSLGLIGRDAANARLTRLIARLPAPDVGGLRLPAWEVSTTGAAPPVPGFNSCDCGRLLSALACLDVSGLMEPGVLKAKLAGWDIAATIRAGRPHNIREGVWSDVTLSHCTHYSARAFGYWGISLASPYDVMVGQTLTDAQMRLLYQVESISSFGAEPLLLEAVEMGPSAPQAYLARVLFSAQVAEFEATDTLVAVSETALNREPWFVYEGLRLGRSETPWETLSVENLPQHRTAQFRNETSLINAKAAYLWAATHPHPYSRKLLAFVRDRARIPGLGFSAGIFRHSGQAMAGYTDINTNAVILQAIRHMLLDRAPWADRPGAR